MDTRPPAGATPQVPWADRSADPRTRAQLPSPRSARDLEILRALARRINPDDASAHNNLGVVYYNKGLYDEAVHHFERALEIDPRMQVAERNLQICYYGTGFLEKLTAELQQRLEAQPDDDDARDSLARTLYNSGDLQGAARELRALLERRPRDAAVYQRLARAELKRGNLDAALVSLRSAEALAPDNPRVQFMIGEVLYQRGLSADARGSLERAIALDERMADAYHLLAFVYGDTGETERANRMSARAAELNPTYSRAEAGLSLDSYSTARYQELIGNHEGVQDARVAEGGELAHYNLGLAFRQKALYDEALREFRLATERGEDSLLVHQAQAEMLLLRGDSAQALELYVELVERESMSPKLWNELGVARHQTGDLPNAEAAYERALEVDPNYALAWNNLGVVRHHMDADDAADVLRRAVQEGDLLSDVWRNLALLLHREGRHVDSEGAYNSALEADPSSASARTGLGILLMDLGRLDEARAQLLRAVEIDARLPEARYQLAFALSALGDYQGALRETKLALELSPYIPAPRFRLLIDLQFEQASVLAPELDRTATISGDGAVRSFEFHADSLDGVFGAADSGGPGRPNAVTQDDAPAVKLLESARQAMEQGLFEQASSRAQRAAMYGARRIDVLLLQGEIFLHRDASGEAVERFNEALAEISREGPGDDASLRRALLGAARSLLDLGRMPEAVEAAERLVELAPGDVEALRTLGDALARVNDHGRAAIVFEHARLSAPDDVNLLTQLGAAYAAAGDPEGAESALRRAVALDSFAVGARTGLARLLAEEGRTRDAAGEYRTALAVLPSYGDAAFGLAELHEREGALREAINVMVDLLAVDPYRLDALNRLGDLLVDAGMPEQARYAYERVLHFDPHDAHARAATADASRREA
jgi:cellulose synthase operon protein C